MARGLGHGREFARRRAQRSAARKFRERKLIVDILFLLIPLSVALGLVILGALGWAVWRGQFDSVEAEGERILRTD
jgi:cbb3-type cytochrome oxidase maturation protein